MPAPSTAMWRHVLRGCAAAVPALALLGCAATQPAEQPARAAAPRRAPSIPLASITLDTSRYLARHFEPGQLPPGVRAHIAAAGTVALPFQTLVVTRRFVRHLKHRNIDVQRRVTDTFVNVGNGFVQLQERLAIHSAPVRLDLALAYVGFLTLERQSLDYRTALEPPPQRLQALSTLTPHVAHPRPGATYTATLRWRRQRTTESCKAGPRFYPAHTLLAHLPGRALNLDCTITRHGTLQAHTRLTYLNAYGLYLTMRRDTGNVTTRGTLIRIVVHRHAPIARLIAPVPHESVRHQGRL